MKMQRTLSLGLVVLVLGAGHRSMAAQETQAEPVPISPPATVHPSSSSSSQPAAKKGAPVERRAAKPSADPIEPVNGPLTRTPGKPLAGASESRATTAGDPGTLKVRSRLVNVTVNVVDAHGAPVGGFVGADFRVFEDNQPQSIAVFENQASSPLSMVMAIDTSETVSTSERLEREAAKRFVRAVLREQDQLDLMDFADTVREVVPFTNQAKRIEEGLSELQHGQETALYDAVYLGSQRLATTKLMANGRRVLVVISDGGDSVDGPTHYPEAIAEAQRADAMIYSIIIVPIAADAGRNTAGEHALIQMSEDTGGKYYYVTNPADLEPAFRRLSDDLRAQYVLGYYAPQEGRAGFRRIKVELTDAAKAGGLALRYRTGYFADAR